MLKMQDAESGGFYHQVSPMSCSNSDQRYVDDLVDGVSNVKPTATTANAVAALAHASVTYRHYDRAFAKQLLTAAEAGWAGCC